MNEVLDLIKTDLKTAMSREVQLRKIGITSGHGFDIVIAHKTVSRAIISMIPELGKKADETTVNDMYKLLKKYIGNEKERMLYTKKYITESDVTGLSSPELKKLVNEKLQELGEGLSSLVIVIAKSYLPTGPTQEDIIDYIEENIDLTKLKNKMQAMGPIMKAFPGCDGNFVKNILLKL